MLIEKFEAAVEAFSDRIAIKMEAETLTYRQLNQYANQVAARIIASTGLNNKGKQAALLFEHGADMIIALIAVLKANMVYVPLDRTYPENRLAYMLEDSEAALILTNTYNLHLAQGLARKIKGKIEIMDIRETRAEQLEGNVTRTVSGEAPAYILYTSGSTGRPKGVIQNHDNVLYYTRNWVQRFSITLGDRMTLLTAFSHDGFVQDLWSALLSGATLYPYDVKNVLDRTRLPEFIKNEKITIWHSVPTLFRYFTDSLTPSEIFPYLRFILLGGEPLRKLDIEIFKRYFPNALLANVYGQTESSVSSIAIYTREDVFGLPILGKPLDKTTILLVTGEGEILEDLGTGEIVIACDHIAPGYWRDEKNTHEKFTHDPDLGKLYWTGDLGRLKGNREIAIMGRKDLQIKIRGFRVEVGEIETILLQHESVKEAAVILKETKENEPYLCCYFTSEEPIDAARLREYLLHQVPDYMVPRTFIPLEHLPITPSGKIDRNALPEPGTKEMEKEYKPPVTAAEKQLAGIWQEVLNLKPGHRPIGIDDNFFELGGHSLRAIRLIARTHKTFQVKLELEEVFSFPVLRELAHLIDGKTHETFTAIHPVEKKEYYPLSSTQKRLYFLRHMEPEGTGYNLSDLMELEVKTDIKKVEEIFQKLIQRHESLRTSFHMIDDQPVQRVHDEVDFDIEYDQVKVKERSAGAGDRRRSDNEGTRGLAPLSLDTPLPIEPAAALIRSFVRPFDLARAPLFRVGMIRLEKNKYIFMMDMHHIISDGTSQEIFSEDFKRLDSEKELPRLKLQYKDYAQWQEGEIEREALKHQGTYWLKEFSSDIPVLELPTDYPRPLIQGSEGDNIRLVMEPEVTQGLKRLAQQGDVTLYMVILAVMNILLYKLSSQEDIVIGTPVVGRRHTDLERIIGMFVNTLAVRNYPQGQKTFTGFLKEVKEKTLKAFENQEYPFEELVGQAAVNRDMSRNPLFDIMFALHNQSTLSPGMLKIMKKGRYDSIPFRKNHSNFDLTFHAIEAGELLGFSVEYSSKLFKKETIRRFTRYMQTIVSSISKAPYTKLADIDVLSKEEIEQLLIEFNRTDTQFPGFQTLDRLFTEQAERTPDQIALAGTHHLHESTILEGTGGLAPLDALMTITYRELNQRSIQLALLLQEKGVKPDTIVGIMVDRSIEMIIGLLGILFAGGAYMPIDPEYPQERIDYILKDSGAKILLSTLGLSGKLEKLLIVNCQLLIINDEPHNRRRLNNPPKEANSINNYQLTIYNLQLEKSNLAYILYTSGTTGKPKGVMVEHRNASAYFTAFNREFDLTGNDIVIQQASFTFDAFFEEVFPALLTGGKVVIPTRNQVKDINLMEEFIIKHSVTIISCTPLMLNLLNQGNKLESVRIFISGGDVLKSEYIGNLLKWAMVYNTYGPTETTVCATYYRCPPDTKSNVPLGKPISNYNVYILDNHHLVPVGIPGEICISGAGVARGYLNNPGLTADKFLSFLHKSYMSYLSYIYKTGDRGRWLPDGNIEFLGRIDSQIKIRGFRIEPGEIENQLLNYKDITAAVIISPGDEAENKHLCAYIVGDQEIDIPPLKKFLSLRLPYYMIPSYVIQVEKIPLTVHGKVDSKALPKPVIQKPAVHQVPGDWWEEQMTLLWCDVLGTSRETLGIDTNFFDIGGHSLKATILAARIHKTFNVKLPLVEIFKQPSIGGQAAYIKNAAKDKYIPITPVEKKEYYDLSSAQKRLYILQQLEPGSTSYNMPQTIPLENETDIKKLEKTFIQLIQRHESLRTSFLQVREKPVQKVHDKVEFEIEYHQVEVKVVVEVKEEQSSRLEGTRGLAPLPIENFIRPFDLAQAPLLRVGLIELTHTPAALRGHPRRGTYNSQEGKEHKYILMIDMHHIITDGTSQDILKKEFISLYQEEESLPSTPLRLQYKDFSRWQNHEKQSQSLKQQEFYWIKAFTDELPVLNLPTDYPRPVMQSFEGNSVNFVLNENQTRTLKNIAKESNATLFMVVLSIFTILLSKLSGQEDIIVGTPIAARRHADLENIIGMFVNTLATRNYPSSEKKFNQFLEEIKWRTLEVFENQEYQFEDLVDKVSLRRDTSRNPIFDVMFNLLNQADYPGPIQDLDEPPGNEPTAYPHRKGTSKFDLYLAAVDLGKRLFFNLEYCTRLFKPGTSERIIGYFKKIISSLSGNDISSIKLSEIEIITDKEKAGILDMSKGIEESYDTDTCIHRLFETQVEKNPHQIALVGTKLQNTNYKLQTNHKSQITNYKQNYNISITHRELNRKSNQLARLLREKGVKPDIVVGLMVERSIEMISSILAVMKAGGAYMPIDTEYPASRQQYMLQDSQVTLLLTNSRIDRASGFIPANIEIIDLNHENIYHGNGMNLPNINKGSDLLYVIYTSGSTGNPKGVMLEHRNLVNLLQYQFKYTNIDCTGILQFTPISFDVSFQEIFSALLAGGLLVLVDRETRTNIPGLFDVIRKNIIKTLFLPMSFLKLIFRQEEYIRLIPGCIEHIVTAGEQVIISNAFRDYLKSNHIYLHNHYGPSETHVVTTLTLDPAEEIPERPAIGKPVLNTMIFILDKGKHLVPQGVPGELYIGGAQVGRGYWGKPGLTQERFIKIEKKVPLERINTSYIYRSGDLAKWLPDGNIEFLGRIDNQVKIRGFRVELGEIESRLLSYKDVEEAIVIARNSPKDEHDRYLCAYLVIPGGIEKAPAVSQLRGYLSQTLPDFMIPSFFVPLARLPLTPNGKVDRKALPEPALELRQDAKYTAPRFEMEEKLVEIWSKVLLERNKTGLSIGIDDNFFELGGNSLKVIQIISEIKKAFNIEVPMGLIFKSPFIRSISAQLMQYKFIATQEEIVLALSPEKTGSEKIFCFPPAIGYGISYMGLVAFLSRYSLYGFNYIEDEDKDRDKMERYVDTIMEIQPEGPYTLLGYSAGGRLCFKAAELLEKRGNRVKDIILLDCYSQRKALPDEVVEERIREFKDGIKQGLEELGLEPMTGKVMDTMERYGQYYDQLMAQEPGIIHADIHLIKAEDKQGQEGFIGWESFTRGEYHEYEGFGIHKKMLSTDFIQQNAAVINNILSTPPNQKFLQGGQGGAVFSKSAPPEIFSRYNKKFLEFVDRNPGALMGSNFREMIAKLGGDVLQPWPTFLDRSARKIMEKTGVTTINLIRSIPRRIFNQDPYLMSRYYQLPAKMIETQLNGVTDEFLETLIGRGDFVLTSSGYKCLEFNIAANIGGLHLPIWAVPYFENPVILRFLKENHIKIKDRDVIDIFLEHMVSTAGETLTNTGGGINIAMVSQAKGQVPGEANESQDLEIAINQRYAKTLERLDNKCQGRVIFCDFDDLVVRGDGLYYREQPVHVLVETYEGAVPPEILHLFKIRRICLFNGPLTGLMSNKLNLALLSEHEDSPLFNEAEREAIKAYIPWTRKIIASETFYQGEKIRLVDFIRGNREQLVMKPAVGYGGEGVAVGKYISQAQWETVLQTALQKGKWLVQEHVPSLPFLYQYGENGAEPHMGVVGILVFGNRFGGGSIRMLPCSKRSGVINVHQGARVSILFEVE